MREKVIERERIKISRTKVSNLQEKTKELKGTEGKQLNQNVLAAVADFDKQLEALKEQTSRDGIEIEEEELEEENKKLEEEKKSLDDILQKIKESYQEKDSQKTKLVLIEKNTDDIIKDIIPDMSKEELKEKAKELLKNLVSNQEMKKEIERMWVKKKVSIKRKDKQGQEQENTITVMDIVNVYFMNETRQQYMEDMQKEAIDENQLNQVKWRFESGKSALEIICDEQVLPLKSEDGYVEQFKVLEQYAKQKGILKQGKNANIVAQKLQNIYATIAPFIGNIETKKLRPAYNKLVEILENNPTVKAKNLPPVTLPVGEDKKTNRTNFVPKVTRAPRIKGSTNVDIEKINKGLEEFVDNFIGDDSDREEGHGEI